MHEHSLSRRLLLGCAQKDPVLDWILRMNLAVHLPEGLISRAILPDKRVATLFVLTAVPKATLVLNYKNNYSGPRVAKRSCRRFCKQINHLWPVKCTGTRQGRLCCYKCFYDAEFVWLPDCGAPRRCFFHAKMLNRIDDSFQTKERRMFYSAHGNVLVCRTRNRIPRPKRGMRSQDSMHTYQIVKEWLRKKMDFIQIIFNLSE